MFRDHLEFSPVLPVFRSAAPNIGFMADLSLRSRSVQGSGAGVNELVRLISAKLTDGLLTEKESSSLSVG